MPVYFEKLSEHDKKIILDTCINARRRAHCKHMTNPAEKNRRGFPLALSKKDSCLEYYADPKGHTWPGPFRIIRFKKFGELPKFFYAEHAGDGVSFKPYQEIVGADAHIKSENEAHTKAVAVKQKLTANRAIVSSSSSSSSNDAPQVDEEYENWEDILTEN